MYNQNVDRPHLFSFVHSESDIRLALNANECGTDQMANQIAEGMWRERKTYAEWTNIRVPIYYFNNDVPTMMNIIFSASNYPNYRANDSLFVGNSLYVDDVKMIYSSKIDKLYIKEREWKAFDPNSTEEQVYSVGKATEIPSVFGVRGAGSITNARGEKATFPGRKLTNSEFQIVQQGTIDGLYHPFCFKLLQTNIVNFSLVVKHFYFLELIRNKQSE